MNRSYFFCGIGGSGMSALAQIVASRGYKVSGSDRGHDKGESPAKFQALEQAGITLYPQDGSGIDDQIDVLVVSSAVEESVPDVRRALDKNIPVQKRAALLAELVNEARGICIGGTSGKTTVTGMTGHMLHELGLEPTIMNGGQIVNFIEQGMAGNAITGSGDLFVTETDESDGSIALFTPSIAVLNNITLDHKPLEDLRPLFAEFLGRAREAAIVNLDDPEAAHLAGAHSRTVTFAIDNPQASLRASDIVPQPGGISFTVQDAQHGAAVPLALKVPGRHNVLNALAALGVARVLGVDLKAAAIALGNFRGTKRRFEVVGTVNGMTVIDDFAHNPDKIEATLKTLRDFAGRVIAIFQPHGYGPTRMLKDGLVAAFAQNMTAQDILLMPEIYYAGGTATKNISSRDITNAVAAQGRQAYFLESRPAILDFLLANVRQGDRIVIMGARDDTLSDFAQHIVRSLKKKAA